MGVPNLCHKQIVLCRRFPLFQFKIIRGFREIENFKKSFLGLSLGSGLMSALKNWGRVDTLELK